MRGLRMGRRQGLRYQITGMRIRRNSSMHPELLLSLRTKLRSIAEDQVIFPAVDGEVSFAQEESQFNNFRCLIEKIQTAGSNSASAEIYSKLCSQADLIMESIQRHFRSEEAEVLPLARLHFYFEKQRELLFKSMCVMPLKLLERVLPWLVTKLNDEEAYSFLQNMCSAASSSDAALVTLLSGWASKGCSKDISNPGKFICLSAAQKGTDYQEGLDQSDQMFKLGWKDIFRMKQNEFESEIRKISRDPTLDPRRKSYLIQNLMTSVWMAAQQKLPQARSEENVDGEAVPGRSSSFCFNKHLDSCCNKLFACHICHD